MDERGITVIMTQLSTAENCPIQPAFAHPVLEPELELELESGS